MKPLAQFASVLWEPEDLIEVRSLPTERGGLPQPESMYIFAEDMVDMTTKLTKMNNAGHNHYAGVLPRINKGGTKDIDCCAGSIVWADFDGTVVEDEEGNKRKQEVQPDEAIAIIMAHRIPAPTMIVNSGHGVHLYWKLTETIPAYTLATLVHDLAIHIGADPTVANPSRIMRLPGFDNLKKPVKPVEIVSVQKEAIHDFNEFRELIPQANYYGSNVTMPEGFGENYKMNRSRREIMSRASSYIQAFDPCLDNRNNAAFSLAACLQKDFALDENEAWIALQEWNTSKCSTPLSNNELYSCLLSGQRYGKKEVGCKLEEKVEEQRPERQKPKKKEEPKSDILSIIKNQIRDEIKGSRQAIPLPWKCLQELPLLFPGKVGVITGLPGASKSFAALNVGAAVSRAQYDWTYAPLEDTKAYHVRRLLSVVDGNWRMAKPFSKMNERRMNKELADMERDYGDLIAKWGPCILDNPAFRSDGTMQAVEHEDALEILEGLCEKNRVVMIDPVAQIEFVGKNEWQVQAQFMRDVIGIANSTDATILLVIHRAKKDNAGVYGVEGSKRFVDLAHTVLSFESCKSAIVDLDGEEQEVDANRIITVEKCRDSILEGSEWVFQFGNCGPLFSERGKLVKRARKKG